MTQDQANNILDLMVQSIAVDRRNYGRVREMEGVLMQEVQKETKELTKKDKK